MRMVAPFEFTNEHGFKLHLLDMSDGAFNHWLREAQRNSVVKQIKPSRPDIGSAAVAPSGLDDKASTVLLKAREKGTITDPKQRTLAIR